MLMRKRREGLTLIEILLSLIVLTLGVLGILSIFPVAMQMSKESVEATQNLRVAGSGVQIHNFEHCVVVSHQPTLPSRLTLSRFWASTANSIGSSRSTSLQNPFTIMEMASSSEMPRWRQ